MSLICVSIAIAIAWVEFIWWFVIDMQDSLQSKHCYGMQWVLMYLFIGLHHSYDGLDCACQQNLTETVRKPDQRNEAVVVQEGRLDQGELELIKCGSFTPFYIFIYSTSMQRWLCKQIKSSVQPTELYLTWCSQKLSQIGSFQIQKILAALRNRVSSHITVEVEWSIAFFCIFCIF